MHARVATGRALPADPRIDRRIEERQRLASGGSGGPPSCVHRWQQGLAISVFENEEDMRQGDATLNSMDPPTQDGMGKRTSVEMYEVPIKLEA